MGSLNCDDRTEQIFKLAQNPNIRLIFSSETMSSPEQFSIITGLVQSGADPIFSVDMRKTEVISKSDQLTSKKPLEMVAAAWKAGVKDMICLLYTSPSPRDRG